MTRRGGPGRHPSVELLCRAVDGDLGPEEHSSLEQHVVDCEACRQRLEQLTLACDRPDGQEDRHAALHARLRDDLARLTAEFDADGSAAAVTTRLPAALTLTMLLVSLLLTGRQQRLLDSLNAPAILGPGRPVVLPIAALTPGAVHRMTAAELCGGRRPADRSVTPLVRQAVLRDYQMDSVPAQEYELDYLITPALGGAATRENLWPERYALREWNAHVKDQIEALLPRMVCEGRLDLATAQHDLAADWIAAYKKYFQTDAPLGQEVAALDDDDVVPATAPLTVLAQLTWR
jgi:Putative zinc-finger